MQCSHPFGLYKPFQSWRSHQHATVLLRFCLFFAVWKAVDSGGATTCGIIALNSSIACWGGALDSQPNGFPIGQLAWKSVTVGGFHACGILMNDTVRCGVVYVLGRQLLHSAKCIQVLLMA
jgi:hypothetical protein